ncbi:MAG: hypothetical protein IH945_05505 [Armatimonadetes bacterium]|nr:hypothetical protein [Armatimonadota bacterium]
MGKKRRARWIVGGALLLVVLAPVLIWNGYSKNQRSFAEESAHRVERALKQLDDNEAAKEIRTELVNEIGEFDSVEHVHWYAHPLPNYAYVLGTVSNDGARYHFQYLFQGDRVRLFGAVEEISDETTEDSN